MKECHGLDVCVGDVIWSHFGAGPSHAGTEWWRGQLINFGPSVDKPGIFKMFHKTMENSSWAVTPSQISFSAPSLSQGILGANEPSPLVDFFNEIVSRLEGLEMSL